jgi:hypothetical protein
MRLRLLPVLFGACLCGSGCHFAHYMKQNVVNEPKLAVEQRTILKRHERLGREAWDEMVGQYGCQFSDDYRAGFIDGFVDYLTFGGVASEGAIVDAPLIPAVPPPRYRRAKNMSPEGLKAAEDWFMGFRHGSNTALASGLRHLVTVPVFDRPITYGSSGYTTTTQDSIFGAPNDATTTLPQPRPVTERPAEGEPLPQPRVVPPGEAAPPPAGGAGAGAGGAGQPPPAPGPAVPGPAVPPAVPTPPPGGPMTRR